MRYPHSLPVLETRNSGSGTVQVNRGQGWSEPLSAPDAWLHDGEWARVGAFYIYPRDGKFHIGKQSGARDYRDVETGFENMQAAIDHARWMVDESHREWC